jgi:hypothetical protein
VHELAREHVTLTSVFASPGAIDALTVEGTLCRVAADEALILGPPPAGGVADPHAVVLDVSDGWSAFRLSGDAPRDAFAYLSALRLPEDGFTQGDVAHVPVKVLVETGAIRLLVPSMWEAHLRERILADCPEVTEVV